MAAGDGMKIDLLTNVLTSNLYKHTRKGLAEASSNFATISKGMRSIFGGELFDCFALPRLFRPYLLKMVRFLDFFQFLFLRR